MVMRDRLFDRIATLLKVNLNELLLDSTDPQESRAHWIAEIESGLAQVKDAVAAAIAREHRLERQWHKALALSQMWDARTDAALQAGDEAHARAALKRKLAYERSARATLEQLERQRQIVADMKASLNALQAKLQDLTGSENGSIILW